MSWSLGSVTTAKQAREQIANQVAHVSLSDASELETVRLVGALIDQALGTFGENRLVRVAASGSMGYRDYQAKTEPYQNFSVQVEPIHLTA